MNTAILLDVEAECTCGQPGCDECETLPLDGDEDDVFPKGYDPDEDEPLELIEVVADDEPTDPCAPERQEEVLLSFAAAQMWAHEEHPDEDDILHPDGAASITESLAGSDRF